MRAVAQWTSVVVLSGLVLGCPDKPASPQGTAHKADAAVVPVPDVGIDVSVPVLDAGSTPDIVTAPDDGPDDQCAVGEGCFMDPCSTNDDCQSGWCVDHLGDPICAKACVDECPAGFSCKSVAGGGADVTWICLSDATHLCRPCADANDCSSPTGAEDACIDYGAQGSFCGAVCEAGDDCPWGFACQDATSVTGAALKQCVSETGVCPCAEKSVQLGLATPCQVTNELGACDGQRICVESGLSDCDAATPAAEACDGVDNDCDGLTDEETCDDGNACTVGVCGGADGCAFQALDSGECLDGDVCTVGDHCEAGVCVGTLISCDDGNVCTDDACDGLGGCQLTPNAAQCDDGDACTLGDHCNDGACAGEAVDCECQVDADCAALEDGDLCNGTLVCNTQKVPTVCQIDPDTVVAVAQGAACDDGDLCTTDSVCSDGICGGGQSVNCADDNPCTTDFCTAQAGCQHEAATGAPCDDGDLCTVGDACGVDGCDGGAKLACDDGNPCTDDSCGAGGCAHDANTAPCDDLNTCTKTDVCSAGVCVGAGAKDCDDGNPCTKDICDPAGCQYENVAAPCTDGDLCTVGDVCKDGACVAGTAVQCDDSNACTDDSCAGGLCVYEAAEGACDDGNVCTLGDHCLGGACAVTGFQFCDDGKLCTTDSCDPDAGCINAPNTLPCDDGSACTSGDACAGGVCESGAAVECVDNNGCTDDACDPQIGCTFTHNTGQCDDKNACTPTDVCVAGACEGQGVKSCDDSDACTTDGCDPVDGCSSVPANLDCGDNNVCTVDSCKPAVGCSNVAVPDQFVCGPDKWCQSGQCVNKAVGACASVGGDSGVFVIDPDGPGGAAGFSAFCEMEQDGGGWTLVMSVDTANGLFSTFAAPIWTTTNEHGDFAQRWSVDYKSPAAQLVAGDALLLIVRTSGSAGGSAIVGWRSWNLDGAKTFNSFFSGSVGAFNANSTGGCNSGHAGAGKKQTSGIKSSGLKATYDTFTGFAQDIYTNSYYGACEQTGDAFRLSSWYRWSNNANVGLGLQMDGSSTGGYSLEAGSHMKIDTYGNPQRYCTSGCSSCSAYPDGGYSSTATLAAIGTDHYGNHCTVGVSYRYEWYIQ